MSVTVNPHGTKPGKWMVRVFVSWDSGASVRERKVVSRPTEPQARRYGQDIERRIIAKGETAVVAEIAEASGSNVTVSDWYAKYHKCCEAGTVGRKNKGKPQTSVGDRRARFANWIEKEIGTKAMRAVTSDDLRNLVRKLDDQIRLRLAFYEEGADDDDRKGDKPGMRWKTAHHVWSEVTSGFREALSSKLTELRVLDVDVTRAVQPPIKTEERQQAALYPSEVLQLLSCEAVPLGRRRVYAFALYIGGRLSEIAGIVADDIDFEHNLIVVNGRKTQAARRRVQIDPNFKPLLKLLVKERPEGALVDCPPADGGRHGAADYMRIDMKTAKLTRKDLWRDDADQAPFTFHGLRHTAITWWYVAGKDATFLKICAGHTSSVMTQRYLDTVAMSRSTFGTPHPPLPPSVLGGAKVVSINSKRLA